MMLLEFKLFNLNLHKGPPRGIFEILFNNDWIESKGRKEIPGRPLLWNTTKEFLIYLT